MIGTGPDVTALGGPDGRWGMLTSMGMYDEVHTGARCGQTKALGQGLRTVIAGDEVRIFPIPMDEEQHEIWLEANTGPVADSAQVLMPEGGYLTIVDAAFVDWVSERNPDLPLFDDGGHPLAEPLDLSEHRYLDVERESGLEAAANGQFDRWQDPAVHNSYGWLNLDGIDPVSDPVGFADRTAAMRAAASEQLGQLRGEPADCPVCAAIRSGTLAERRAN